MFLGEYQHSLDNKGRVIMPACFREELGTRFFAVKGLEKCVFLFPVDEWKDLEGNLRALSMAKKEARSFLRIFFSGAAELELDKQGRTVLPLKLREYAGIERDIVIIGVGSRLEIWDRGEWENYSEIAQDSYEQIAETLVDLGI